MKREQNYKHCSTELFKVIWCAAISSPASECSRYQSCSHSRLVLKAEGRHIDLLGMPEYSHRDPRNKSTFQYSSLLLHQQALLLCSVQFSPPFFLRFVFVILPN
ncbi:hypothetical protein AMECASPLE_001609 [Ameca splendens]|uniref:Uncharacterized protein n=1 Tax=Ameca splendens TaxID=208324 RepID=A0ABV0ZTX9_9TELE